MSRGQILQFLGFVLIWKLQKQVHGKLIGKGPGMCSVHVSLSHFISVELCRSSERLALLWEKKNLCA